METKKNSYAGYIRLSVLLMPVLRFLNTLAPGVVKWLIKKGIKRSNEFVGQVAALKFSLLKGCITIKGLHLDVVENNERLNFVHIDNATIQLSAKKLLKGIIAAEITINGLSLTFIKDKTRLHQRGATMNNLPLIINSFSIININIEYIDHTTTPQVKLNGDSINLYGSNLTTLPDYRVLPTKIQCRGNIYGGELSGNVNLNLSGESPAFDLNLDLKNVLMPRLNSLFSAYGKFKVESGLLSFYTEAAAKDGQFKGYVKPFINELSIKEDDEHNGVLNTLWQGMLTAATEIFKNHKEDQIATKFLIEGKFSSPDINVWYAIGEVLKNAFFTALKPSIDHEINITSVER